MTKPLDRFRMLENARPAGTEDAAPHDSGRSQRFAAVATSAAEHAAAATPPPAPAPVAHDPFAPPPEPGPYELEPRDARATRRCAECGYENSRSEHDVCARCDAPLDSRAAKHLNLQLEQDERTARFAEKQAAAQAQPVAQDLQLVESPFERAAWPGFDRTVDRVVRGPMTTWPMPMRRVVAIAGIAGLLGLLYLVTGVPAFGFLVALVVSGGVFLVLA